MRRGNCNLARKLQRLSRFGHTCGFELLRGNDIDWATLSAAQSDPRADDFNFLNAAGLFFCVNAGKPKLKIPMR